MTCVTSVPGTFETSYYVRFVVANVWKADMTRTAQFGRE
jgi:hypothetical protein